MSTTMDTNKIREALRHLRDIGIVQAWPHVADHAREALAELDKPAEPVAWMVKTRIGVEWVITLGVTKTGARQIAIERYRNGSDVQHMDPIPLYTHPPQAAGLTMDEVIKCVDDEVWTARDCIEDDPMSGITDHITKMVSSIHARLIAAIQAKS